jgi:hypothetical protein
MKKHIPQYNCEISGSHGSEYEDESLLGYGAGAIFQKTFIFTI